MAKLLTVILVFCAATTLAAWAVAAAKLRIENGKCRIAELSSVYKKRANPQFSILHSTFSINTAIFVFFAAIATLSAQKQGATNDLPRGASSPRAMPPAPAVVPVAVDSAGFSVPTNFPPVTNLCFWGVGRGTNAVSLGIAWPLAASFADGFIDLYGGWRLASNAWARLAQVDVGAANSNAVVELPFSCFPTNAMEGAAFFAAADRTDSDGDGLPDAYERLVSGSSPSSPDTDGDGIPDGDEVGLGTSPNSADTDGDGFSDYDEARLFQTDPRAPDADTDSDGLPDAAEVRIGTSTCAADTDLDGLGDTV